MRVDKQEFAVLSRIFSATVFRDLAGKGKSPLLARLLRQTRLVERDDSRSLGDTFDEAFRLLRTVGHRDEYVYRTAIAQKIVVGKHRWNATMLTEMRAGACKADVVVLNGTATVYEIKSERDSFSRLVEQVENYRRVFAAVNVITSPNQAGTVTQMIPADVGVSVLTDGYTIRALRDAEAQPWRTCPATVLDSLRTDEAIAVLERLEIAVPEVPNMHLRGALRELFAAQDPSGVHEQMVQVLRLSRSHQSVREFVESVPASLRASALATRLPKSGQVRLQHALSSPISIAMAWG